MAPGVWAPCCRAGKGMRRGARGVRTGSSAQPGTRYGRSLQPCGFLDVGTVGAATALGARSLKPCFAGMLPCCSASPSLGQTAPHRIRRLYQARELSSGVRTEATAIMEPSGHQHRR